MVPSLVALSGFICLNAHSTCSSVKRQNSQAGGGYWMFCGTADTVGLGGKKAVLNTSPFSELSLILHTGCPVCLTTRSGTLARPPSEDGCDMKLHISHMLLLPAASNHSIQYVVLALSMATAYLLRSSSFSSCMGWSPNILNLYAFFCTLHSRLRRSVSSPVHHHLIYGLGLVHGTYSSMVSCTTQSRSSSTVCIWFLVVIVDGGGRLLSLDLSLP